MLTCICTSSLVYILCVSWLECLTSSLWVYVHICAVEVKKMIIIKADNICYLWINDNSTCWISQSNCNGSLTWRYTWHFIAKGFGHAYCCFPSLRAPYIASVGLSHYSIQALTLKYIRTFFFHVT